MLEGLLVKLFELYFSRKQSMYTCEELTNYVNDVIERMESLHPHQLAPTLIAFVQR